MNNTLFITEVGSTMWHMERPDSDTDLFKAYIAPTYDILSGIGHQNSHFGSDEKTDIASHEIGVVVSQLIKGNVNFIWGVHSPIVVNDMYNALAQLREISAAPSSNCYPSIRGLARHNYTKYIIDRKEPVEIWQKRINIICRTLLFGINALERHEYQYVQVYDGTPELVVELMDMLERKKAETTLPPSPSWEQEARKWLFGQRILELGEACR
jgi:predicted nucleotidyltransferase